jgi:hypothetical protein
VRRTAGGFGHRIAVQLERDARGGVAVADGYSTSTFGSGGGGGGASIHVPADEHGPDERVPVTSTEAAAIAHLRRTDDEHHRLTWAAWFALEEILAAAQLVHGWLSSLEAAGTPVPDDDAWCENHLRHGATEPRDHASRRRTCRWCYEVQRAYGALPNKALIERRARGERMTDQSIVAALGVAARKAG